MSSRIGVTTSRQILWSNAVLELRQGSRWLGQATAYKASELLSALLPRLTLNVSGAPRRALDEQVMVDELHASRRLEHGLFVDGFIPGMGWGTTLGIGATGGTVASKWAAPRRHAHRHGR
jgi:hypothetical protein